MARAISTATAMRIIFHSRNICRRRSRARSSTIRGRMRGRKSCGNSCGGCGEKNTSINIMNWICKKFAELSVDELYAVLKVRSEVFVVEQNCVFLDTDNKDQYCHHLMGWDKNELAAYARIVPAGISYEESSIGRIVTSRAARREGYGKSLLQHSIEMLYTLHGNRVI